MNYQTIEDWLVTALEGGSNYWYYLPDLSMLAPETKGEPLAVRIAESCWDTDVRIPVFDIEGDSGDEPLGFISRENFERGCTLYAEDDRPDMSEDFDADDADVWFQYVVMGEVVYG